MEKDVWFSRLDDQLYVAIVPAGDAPDKPPVRCSNVNKVYRWLKDKGHTVATVGIVPPDMLGLE